MIFVYHGPRDFHRSFPSPLIRSSNQKTAKVMNAASRKDPSKSEPNIWYSGSVENKFTVPSSGVVSGLVDGGGKDVRSWMRVESR